MAPVTINMTDKDFDYLFDDSMQWGPDWIVHHDGRFQPEPSPNWALAYWFDTYIAVVLARSYLDSLGEAYHQASDEGGDGSWVLFTDWKSPCWRR